MKPHAEPDIIFCEQTVYRLNRIVHAICKHLILRPHQLLQVFNQDLIRQMEKGHIFDHKSCRLYRRDNFWQWRQKCIITLFGDLIIQFIFAIRISKAYQACTCFSFYVQRLIIVSPIQIATVNRPTTQPFNVYPWDFIPYRTKIYGMQELLKISAIIFGDDAAAWDYSFFCRSIPTACSKADFSKRMNAREIVLPQNREARHNGVQESSSV